MRSILSLLLVCLGTGLCAAPEGAPLPSPETILKAMAARQEAQDPLKERFLYTETVHAKVLKEGKVEEDKTDAFEVVRVGKRTLRRQILKAGKPLTEKEAAKADAKLQKEALEAEKEGPAAAMKNLKIRDFAQVCEFEPVREEEGAYLLAFHPRKHFKPKNKEEEMASKLSGTLRVDASTYDLLAMKGRTEEKISVLLGVAALYDGAEFQMNLERQEGGVMFPRTIQFKGKARMFWKHVELDIQTTYSDFKATGMETSEIRDVKVIEKAEAGS